jgi:polar amino acid transport system substrate-binding protein
MIAKRLLAPVMGLALAALGASSALADLKDIISSGTVRIGISIDQPPFGFNDEQQQPAGLDVDLARLVAEALGAKLEIVQVTGPNRIPFLLTNKIDICICVIGATPERAKQIAFSSPYAPNLIGVFGPKSVNVKSPDDLGTKTIGLQRGSTSDTALSEMAPNAKVRRFDDDASYAAAFFSGQVDFFATSSIIARGLAKKDPDKAIEMKFVIRSSPPHMGIRHGNPELLRWLDTFIFYNIANGKLSALTTKWLGEPIPPGFPSL